MPKLTVTVDLSQDNWDKLAARAAALGQSMELTAERYLIENMNIRSSNSQTATIMAWLRAGYTNKQAKARMKVDFPKGEASAAYISWCRNAVRKTDPSVPTDAEAREQKQVVYP